MLIKNFTCSFTDCVCKFPVEHLLKSMLKCFSLTTFNTPASVSFTNLTNGIHAIFYANFLDLFIYLTLAGEGRSLPDLVLRGDLPSYPALPEALLSTRRRASFLPVPVHCEIGTLLCGHIQLTENITSPHATYVVNFTSLGRNVVLSLPPIQTHQKGSHNMMQT